MHILNLKVGGAVVIGGKVQVAILRTDAGHVRVGVVSPEALPVEREETYLRGFAERLGVQPLRLALPLTDGDIADACSELLAGREVTIGQVVLRPDPWAELVWSRDAFGNDRIASPTFDERGCRGAISAATTAHVHLAVERID